MASFYKVKVNIETWMEVYKRVGSLRTLPSCGQHLGITARQVHSRQAQWVSQQHQSELPMTKFLEILSKFSNSMSRIH